MNLRSLLGCSWLRDDIRVSFDSRLWFSVEVESVSSDKIGVRLTPRADFEGYAQPTGPGYQFWSTYEGDKAIADCDLVEVRTALGRHVEEVTMTHLEEDRYEFGFPAASAAARHPPSAGRTS